MTLQLLAQVGRRAALGLLAGLALAVAACSPGGSQGNPPAQKDTVLNFYSIGDTNVQDLHEKDMLPGFEKASGVKVTFSFLQSGVGASGIYDRILAQKQSNRPTWDIDLFETDPGYYTRPDDVFQPVSDKEIPNLKMVPKNLLDVVNSRAVPYRGSSVVLAYNSTVVKDPPKTFDDLLAWIKANPGKFAYNEPSTGGSGDAFVVAMIYKYSDYNKYASSPFNADNEKEWDPAFRELKELAPSLYQQGTYPKGNAGTLDLLNRGEIVMGPVWSDQALQAQADGRLPKEVKLVQINPAFNGGAAYIGVTAKGEHKQAAYDYLNYLLDANQQKVVTTGRMKGYPGIDWQYLPADARNQFSGVDKDYRIWPGGQYGDDMKKLWHEKVAAG
jgi:putative spermidine/putrescine transport system substrate-binding protein